MVCHKLLKARLALMCRMHPPPQIWRLVTNFCFLGKFSFNFVFYMIWILTYGVALERETYAFDPAGYLFLYLCAGVLMLIMSFFFKSLGMIVNSISLVYTLIYIWSRNFPDSVVKILGLVSVQSFYLPFAFLAVEMLFDKSPIPGAIGIVVGHVYWFLKELYPASSGRNLLPTPRWLQNFTFQKLGLGPNPTPSAVHVSGFQAFRSGGRRLGTS
jgi:Derlin-2/3